jgi:hypothetical protein
MRRQGISSFPDPAATAQLALREAVALGAPGIMSAVAQGGPGGWIAIPPNMSDSPAFKQAALTCGLPGTWK